MSVCEPKKKKNETEQGRKENGVQKRTLPRL